MKYKSDLGILFIFCISIISACTTPPGIETPYSTPVSIPTPSDVSVGNQPTTVPAKTPIQLTSVSSFPSATPQPTLTIPEAEDVILNMLKNNGGCKLPCVWGFSPGKTSWDEAENFIKGFGSKNTSEDFQLESSKSSGRRALHVHMFKGNLITGLTIGIHKEGSNISNLQMGFSSMEKGTGNEYRYLYDSPHYKDLFEYYLLPSILSNYGIPSQTIIAAFPTMPEHPNSRYPFDLVLFYEDQGFFVEYDATRKTMEPFYVGCPTDAWISIVTWKQGRYTGLGELVENYGGGTINKYNFTLFRSIDQATEMSIDEFYTRFSDPLNTSCIETPMELWQLD